MRRQSFLLHLSVQPMLWLASRLAIRTGFGCGSLGTCNRRPVWTRSQGAARQAPPPVPF